MQQPVIGSCWFERVTNRGGGNCLFEAVEEGLGLGSGRVRQDCVAWLTDGNNWQRLPDGASSVRAGEAALEHEAYLRHIGSAAAWGGEAELWAITQLYNTSVAVVSDGAVGRQVSMYGNGGRVLWLFYSGGSHYELLRPVPGYLEVVREFEQQVRKTSKTHVVQRPLRTCSALLSRQRRY